jgi:hypothetical protein
MEARGCQRVVVGVEGRIAAAAAAAVDVAIAQAAARGVPLHLVGAYPQHMADEAWAARDAAVNAATIATRRAFVAAPELTVVSHIVPGELAGALVEECGRAYRRARWVVSTRSGTNSRRR